MTKDKNNIEQAVKLLQSAELVAFPTETVYGLGADASNPIAIAKLYAAKGRPNNHPVIVHLSDISQLQFWASSVSDAAFRLAEKFWPGPLTLILPKAKHVLCEITGGQDTVGLRIPAHPLALDLLRAFGNGVVAPSANRFGKLSPTRAEDVRNEFRDEVALVIDGGPCMVGIESTIVDLSKDVPMILRPGMIEQSQIEAIIGAVQSRAQSAAPISVTRVPGDLPSHYAPMTPLKLVDAEQLHKLAQDEVTRNRVAVLSFAAPQPGINWIVANRDPYIFARDLYQNLRKLDKFNVDQIIVEAPPKSSDWDGIRDRLERAAK